MNERNMQEAVERLRQILLRLNAGGYETDIVPSVGAQMDVLNRYQPVLMQSNLEQLTENEFRSFLMFRNNRHWTGLERQGPRICQNMPALRQALTVLQDEDRSIVERYDFVMEHIKGMGRAITTAILLVLFPSQYGVWNKKSEAGLKIVDIWPDQIRGESEGSRYARINQLLLTLCKTLDVDLWTLDTLWHYLLIEEKGRTSSIYSMDESAYISDESDLDISEESLPNDLSREVRYSFGLERQLQDFLWDNWDQTELGQEWKRYTEAGDERSGYEHICKIGRIDILAQHRKRNEWLVIELKRGQSSDDTLGQTLRYMGWVQQHLAGPGDLVKGLIISRSWDEKLSYAVMPVVNVQVMVYKVQFSLEATVGV